MEAVLFLRRLQLANWGFNLARYLPLLGNFEFLQKQNLQAFINIVSPRELGAKKSQTF